MKAYTGYNTRETPQDQPMPGQVPNSAGGNAWPVDDWTRLDRFLILGSEGGTFYIEEQKLTRENAEAVQLVLATDGPRAVARIVEISKSGRAPKNEPAIFALAMAFADHNEGTRRAARAALPEVCRIGTHLFHFAQYVEQFRGWGRVLKGAVADWYQERDVESLAYQVVKYQQRDGWSHRDLLRLSHPEKRNDARGDIYNWVTKERDEVIEVVGGPDLALIRAFEIAKEETSRTVIIHLIQEYNLPREAIPTKWLKEPAVWEALLEDMPMHAMIRNLATMTRVGLIAPMSAATSVVVGRLHGEDDLRKARVHPVDILKAALTYASGQSVRGSNTWTPVTQVIDALDAAFYLSFGNIEPSGKRHMLALDISASMTWENCAGVPGLTPRVGAAAMALVTANVEPNHMFVGFSHELTPLTISPRQRLNDVVSYTTGLPFGGTDCAQPMLYALSQGLEIDMFVVLTDNETWAGNIHPAQSLEKYRQKTGIPAKLAVVGMTSNGFTIADPNDGGMLDCVGFDTATPQIIGDFAR